MKNIRLCPICNYDKIDYLLSVKLGMSPEMQSLTNYPDSYDVVHCQNCGMIYADISVTNCDVDKYYQVCNMYSNISCVKKAVYNISYKPSVKKLLVIPKNAHIIDVGCGNGTLLSLLKDNGYNNLFGLDPSVDSISYLREKYGLNGIVGSVYDIAPELHECYDVVIFSGVLEHVLYPDECIKNLKKLLKPDGLLFLFMPNAEGFGQYICDLPNYFNFEHINYFTSKTLDTLCNQNHLVRVSPDSWLRELSFTEPKEMTLSAVYKVDNHIDIKEYTCDMLGKDSVLEFIRKTESKKSKLKLKVENIIQNHKSCIIWGSGSFAGTLLGQYPELRDKVKWIVDNNSKRWEQIFWDKEIKSPQSLYSLQDIPILICVMLNNSEVINQIENMGLKNKVYIMTV